MRRKVRRYKIFFNYIYTTSLLFKYYEINEVMIETLIRRIDDETSVYSRKWRKILSKFRKKFNQMDEKYILEYSTIIK